MTEEADRLRDDGMVPMETGIGQKPGSIRRKPKREAQGSYDYDEYGVKVCDILLFRA